MAVENDETVSNRVWIIPECRDSEKDATARRFEPFGTCVGGNSGICRQLETSLVR